jgi:hypothetical protein
MLTGVPEHAARNRRVSGSMLADSFSVGMMTVVVVASRLERADRLRAGRIGA